MKQLLSLKEKLKSGKTVIGTWCEIPSPEFIHVLAKAGFDFVIIDMEHGPTNFETALKMVMAVEIEKCSPIIRVPKLDESYILRALETGAEGIIVPHINTVIEREQVIRYIKFAPYGNRSLNPYTKGGGYRSQPNFTKEQNKKTIAAILVEDKIGIKNINEIVNDPYLDIVYMGTYDISVALGVPGETKSGKVLETVKKMARIITKAGKTAGCMFHTKEEFAFYKKLHVNFLCFKVDTSIVFDEAVRIMRLK